MGAGIEVDWQVLLATNGSIAPPGLGQVSAWYTLIIKHNTIHVNVNFLGLSSFCGLSCGLSCSFSLSVSFLLFSVLFL